MARPIRNTPIITGKDATAFIQAVFHQRQSVEQSVFA